MTTVRNERVQRQVDQAIERGWKIESESPERVVLVKRNYGDLLVHVVIAIFTFWWTMGLVNVAYAAYKYVNDSDRKVLRKSHVRACPECNATVRADATFCPACGTDLARAATTDETTCPNCDAVVAESADYCRNCGAELAEGLRESS